MGLYVVKSDITLREVDAIVCTANSNLKLQGNMGTSILKNAGIRIQEECDSLAPCECGDCKVTKGYGLPAKYVIHACGPVYVDGSHNEEILLRKTYQSILSVAARRKIHTLELPLISTGVYKYPLLEGAKIAVDEIKKYLKKSTREISIGIVVYSTDTYNSCKDIFKDIPYFTGEGYQDSFKGSGNFGELDCLIDQIKKDRLEKKYIDLITKTSDKYRYSEKQHFNKQRERHWNGITEECIKKPKQSIEEEIAKIKQKEGFHDLFNKYFSEFKDKSGLSENKIVAKVDVSKSLITRYKNYKYKDGFSTRALSALALLMQLSYDQVDELLNSAGLRLSEYKVEDVVFIYCFQNQIYDLNEINGLLEKYNCPPVFYCI